jgi:hypothetical protein
MPKGVYERPTEEERFWSKVDKKDDNSCWTWFGSKDRDGYGWFCFTSTTDTNKYKTIGAHRYSLMIKLNNFDLPSDVLARHTCDVRDCVNPNHLIEGSAAENSQDMIERNRQATGADNGNAIITEEQAIDIIATYHNDKVSGKSYGSLERLAEKHNLRKQAVYRITSGQTWKYLTRPK